MKRKLWRSIVAGVLLVTGLCGCSLQNQTIRFGAAGIGGAYYAFGRSFSEVVMEEDDHYTFEVKTTAGSQANLRLLSDNYVQAAIAQADLAHDAYYGEGTFEDGKKYQGYKAVAALYTEACQIVVRADSQITSLDDLQGKKISIGEEESGTELNAKQILAACGLTPNVVEEVNLDYTDAAKQLRDGQIDVLFCTAGFGTTMIEELAKKCDIKLISIDETTADRLKKGYAFYQDVVIPANTYKGQEEDIHTLGVKALFLVNEQLSDSSVYFITKTLFESGKKLDFSVKSSFKDDSEDAVKGVTIPFHKGAKKYYKEQGIKLPKDHKK